MSPHKPRRQVSYFSFLAFLILFFFTKTGLSHEIRPSIITLHIDKNGGYELSIKTNLEALISNVGSNHKDTDDSPNAAHYNALRKLPPIKLGESFTVFKPLLLQQINFQANHTKIQSDNITAIIPEIGDVDLARDTTITIKGELPKDSYNIQFGWNEKLGASALRVLYEETEIYTAYLQAGVNSENILLEDKQKQTASSVFSDYISIGFAHILPKGLDHILFVIGLFLLSSQFRPLLWQITSFTAAHSITLALGIFGLVTIPASIVEPLIAASIIYIALENIYTNHLTKWRPIVIFLFGLLHGLGFASVLTEIGLSKDYFVSGLIGFNIGVELGQLAVILICFLAVGLWFRKKSWYRQVITIPASLIIAIIGVYWLLERTLL
jgi:hydrogenase/urease accessory protein HupE